VSHSNSFVSSYVKKKDHFSSERMKSVHSKKKAVANARDLMDDAARVRTLEYDAACESLSNERDAGMIASSVSDTYLRRNAVHQGFISQANHVIRKGVNYQQLTEFEAAISTLEQDNGGSTMTSSGVNLSSSRAAKQRARNTGPLGLLGVSLLADEDTATAAGGAGRASATAASAAAGGAGRASATAASAGRRHRGGSGREAVVDLVAGHSVTPVTLKKSAIEKVSMPANWPFDDMLTRTRARAMKRMTDRSITDSARKKACTVRTALANNVETYVSIVRDMIPVEPASQDVLNVCLTQASLEAKK
jgi:hypothetical protein